MSALSIGNELRARITRQRERSGGNLPEKLIVAWRAYLFALSEWEVIDLKTFEETIRMIPEIEDDPAVAISLGREEQ